MQLSYCREQALLLQIHRHLFLHPLVTGFQSARPMHGPKPSVNNNEPRPAIFHSNIFTGISCKLSLLISLNSLEILLSFLAGSIIYV